MKRLWIHVVVGLWAGLLPGAWQAKAQTPSPTQLQSQPSQQPLLERHTRGVPPNIMLTLEDSGAMLLQHLPHNKVVVGAYSVAHPADESSVRMHPDDPAILSGFFIGTVAAVTGSKNWRQKLLRSAHTNWLYYNPEVRYEPWPLASGQRMPAYPANAAPLDPMNPVTVVNLTQRRSITDAQQLWCYRTNAQTGCAKTTSLVSFDPGLYYRLIHISGLPKDPALSDSYTEHSINTAGSYFKYPARTDCPGSSCTQAQEQQNFANWFTYSRSRALMLKGAVAEALRHQRPDLRLGWGRINQSTSRSIDGVNTPVIDAGVRDFNLAVFLDWLYRLPANGASPWAQALRVVGDYVKRTDAAGPWAEVPGSGGVQLGCRRQHHIAVADGAGTGLTTSVGNVDANNGPLHVGPGRSYQYKPVAPYKDLTSNMLADYTMASWSKDLRPDLDNTVQPTADNPAFWQHLVTHVLALGVHTQLHPQTDLPGLTDGSKTWSLDGADDLWHAALNAHGVFGNVRSATELTQTLQSMLAQAIDTPFDTGSATARRSLHADNRLYVSSARSHSWQGDLKAYQLDAQGKSGGVQWSAQARLPAWQQRKITTWRDDMSPPTMVDFTWANLGEQARAALGDYASDRAALVDYVRGDRSQEGVRWRQRQGVLGDITQAPLVLGGERNFGYSALPAAQGGEDYAKFLEHQATLPVQIVTGGNDGMLHVFEDSLGLTPASDGQEVFAFVPRAVLPRLSRLADPSYGSFAAPIHSTGHSTYHQFFVDGPLTEVDAFITAPGAQAPTWRKLVLAHLGAGGPGLVALDLTAPTQRRVVWELPISEHLGVSAAPVASGVLPNGEWVAVFGNGRFSSSGQSALLVVNLQTGALQSLVLENNSALGGVAVLRNSRAQIIGLYAGDMNGQVWKFDYAAQAPARFVLAGAQPLFQAQSPDGLPQPITQAPLVLESSRGGVMLVMGTGTLSTDSDADHLQVQSIYGVWDKPQDARARPVRRQHLATRSLQTVEGPALGPGVLTLAGAAGTLAGLSGAAVNWANQSGYVVDLSLVPGLRVIEPMSMVSGSTGQVPVHAPARTAQVCDVTPARHLKLLLDLHEGLALGDTLADTNGDGVVNHLDARVAAVGVQLGAGSVLQGQRVCVAGVCDTLLALPATSAGPVLRLRETMAATGARVIQDRTWRRIINAPVR